MASRDPRVDAYIAAARPFAQPILRALREAVHRACPAAVETIKWGFPHFEHHGLLCSMAAFKAHCAFGFWQGERVVGTVREGAMGQLGRIASPADLPPAATLDAWITQAAALNASREKRPRPLKHPKPALAVPETFAAALRARPAAQSGFEGLSPG